MFGIVILPFHRSRRLFVQTPAEKARRSVGNEFISFTAPQQKLGEQLPIAEKAPLIMLHPTDSFQQCIRKIVPEGRAVDTERNSSKY